MTQIKDLVTYIKYGPHLKTEMEGSARYIKGNHFDEDYNLMKVEDSWVKSENGKYLLQENDVLVAAKGFRNFAWKYSADAGPCVASSLFYVIRLDEIRIHPDYFVACMNSSRVQHRLKNIGLGATIPAIPKNELLRIDLNVPSMEDQSKAILFYKILNEEIGLYRKILAKKIEMKKGILNLLTTKILGGK